MRPRRPSACRVAACLAFGAGATIAVAMLCVSFGRWAPKGTIDTSGPVRFGSDAYPIMRGPIDTRTGLGVRFRQIWWFEEGEIVDRYDWTHLLITDEESIEYGWPMYALATPSLGLEGVRAVSDVRECRRRAAAGLCFWFLPESMSEWRRVRVPTEVRPVGFVVCMLFWGTVGGTALALPGAVIRALRRWRGLCAACGYDAAGLGVCPECGAPTARFGHRAGKHALLRPSDGNGAPAPAGVAP